MPRLNQIDSMPTVALPPRLQSLLMMKRLWSEYSSLLVRTQIGMTDSAKASSAVGHTAEPVPATAPVNNIQSRWRNEARAIQFDFEFKAVEDERRRVAKELHDEILPSLARLVRSLQGCGNAVEPLVDAIHCANATFRDLLGELHPVDLEELGLVAALDNVCKRYARNNDRVILFFERSDECLLSKLQQLSVYRVVQSLLRMFSDSKNDILTVTYKKEEGISKVVVRCADKLVSSADWITAARDDFSAFESWCTLAGAKVEFNQYDARDQFPSDVVISIPDEIEVPAAPDVSQVDPTDLSQVRLAELHSILTIAKEEWARLINRDRALFEALAIESERKNISADIDRTILPRLQAITQLASLLSEPVIRQDIAARMRVIEAGLNAVLSELHSRLLEKTGLVDSIQILVARFRRASLIDATVTYCEEAKTVSISQEAKFAIYRVTQEALNNIEKHSSATRALVTVAYSNDSLVISIEDNGKGLLQGNANTLSRGLRNIRERATAIGAQVDWHGAASYASGTMVEIKLSGLC